MFGRGIRLAWGRRRLLALSGVAAAVAAKAITDQPDVAHADGRLIGAPLGYTPYDPESDGVQGYATGANNTGTLGRNNDLNGVGLYGIAPAGVGVHGESVSGTAVGARSANGIGVYAASSANFAVFASSTSNYAIVGVSSNNYGLNGQSGTSIGVVGSSTSSTGVYGATGSGVGVVGSSSVAGGKAAAFYGPVDVYGAFTVVGGYPKSAAVVHPDGTHRRMFCVESPDSLFEDSGSGTLVGGRTQVPLDADFAALVTSDNYQVFITPEGDCRGLFVTGKTEQGFEVRELQGGTSSIPFSFRILARRKDLKIPRMEKVTPLKQPEAPQPVTVTPSETNPTQPVPIPVERTT